MSTDLPRVTKSVLLPGLVVVGAAVVVVLLVTGCDFGRGGREVSKLTSMPEAELRYPGADLVGHAEIPRRMTPTGWETSRVVWRYGTGDRPREVFEWYEHQLSEAGWSPSRTGGRIAGEDAVQAWEDEGGIRIRVSTLSMRGSQSIISEELRGQYRTVFEVRHYHPR